jgi:hypothetical protein
MGAQGTIDVNALIVGDWSEVLFVHNAVEYQLGNCPEGELKCGREYYQHQGTQLPRRVDAVFLISASMSFSGQLEEVHERNCRFALGKDPSVDASYIYIGGSETPQFITLVGRRFRPGDAELIEFKIYKGLVVSEFAMNSTNEAVKVPLEVQGLDDQAGDFGGSAEGPLGYLYVPNPE